MSANHQDPLHPPADVPEMRRGEWLALPASDPVGRYLAARHLAGIQAASWEAARLSQAAYVYRVLGSGRTVVAKFYSAKVGPEAAHYAGRELANIRRAWAAGLDGGDLRAVQPLGTWRGVLFLEYVEGLTLHDTIAVRKSQPGVLVPRLEAVARLLARLHTNSVQKGEAPRFRPAIEYGFKVIDNLARHGVLQDDPVTHRGLRHLVEAWAQHRRMSEFTPALIHGDATTTNFVFPWSGGAVALDWERLYVADPASDLGRLMAEVAHSTSRHGGSLEEADALLGRVVDAYSATVPAGWDAAALVARARYYRATSTMRIARNGWLSRLERTALVGQAMALLGQASTDELTAQQEVS